MTRRAYRLGIGVLVVIGACIAGYGLGVASVDRAARSASPGDVYLSACPVGAVGTTPAIDTAVRTGRCSRIGVLTSGGHWRLITVAGGGRTGQLFVSMPMVEVTRLATPDLDYLRRYVGVRTWWRVSGPPLDSQMIGAK